jgi:superfamily II DNA or RNA helicase
MNEIYAEIGEDNRIVLFTRNFSGDEDETLWNDSYQIKMIPGKKWDRKAKRWTLPKSYAACIVLRELFGDRIVVEPELAAWARSERDHRDEVLALREALSLDERSEFANEHDADLFPFQIPGRDFLVKARFALLADQMGSGKTFQTIAAIRAADEIGEAYPALIVCPNSLKRNWEREIKRWLPEANPFVIQGSAAKRRVQITEAAEADNAIIIVNIEAMKLHSRLSSYGSTRLKRCMECETKTQPGTPDLKESACEVHEKELNRIPFKAAVLDECVPYDTEIITSTGVKHVHEVRNGDLVLGVDHRTGERAWSEVRGVRRSALRETVKIGELELTGDHPVWMSDEGLLCYANQHAENYRNDKNLRVVRESVSDREDSPAVLFEEMFRTGTNVEPRSEGAFSAGHARTSGTTGSAGQATCTPERAEEPRTGPRDQEEGARGTGSEGVSELDRGKWSGSYRPAADVVGSPGNGMGTGVSSIRVGEDSELSELVQAGHSLYGTSDRYRGAREGSRQDRRTGEPEGSEETRVSTASWLDDSMGVERTHPERSLWNLETATGNYFANRVLVHNCHRVKDPNALQTRAIWNVFHGPTVEYRWALTGTPVANHPGDLWSIMHAIAPETYPAKSAFIDRYARIEYNHFGGMSIVGLKPDTKEEFFKILDPHFRRMIKADVLKQLPDKVFMRRDVEMSPKQAKAYKDIAEQLVTVLEDGTVLVANGNLAGATRLLQFASAYCEVDQGENPEDPATWLVSLTDNPKSSKIDELMSIIEDDPGKPMVIAAEHRQLIDLAAARMTDAGIPFARVTGGVSADERDAAVQAFQDGKIDFLLFTYKAGGVGLNLTRADTMVRLQRSWSLVDNNQGVDRIHRIGSEVHDKVTIIDLVAAGTIEETQLERLYDKAERLEEIVRDRAKLLALGKTTDDLDSEAARIEATGLMGA